MRTATTFLLALSAVLAGCQSPDVGQPCTLQVGQDPSAVNLNTTSVPADFLESGADNGCDNLVCIKSPDQPSGSAVKSNPYCSKQCVSNSDCFQDETGLVCRQVMVDRNFINSLPDAQRREYYQILGCQLLADGTPTQCPLQFESYCATPLQ
jgi:hypothetical protein